MHVRLISVTPCAENLIVDCARVSNPSNQGNYDTAPKLISYLIKHEHWSPFEMAHMVLEIKTSRAIAAQILRHRSFSFQEFSQRYSETTEFEDIELRKQSDKNRQSSFEIFNPILERWREIDGALIDANDMIERGLSFVENIYTELVKNGVAKECARMVLPLCTSTTLYMAGNIRSWIHYIKLRSQSDTQKEHREIAEEVKKIFVVQFPSLSQSLNWS